MGNPLAEIGTRDLLEGQRSRAKAWAAHLRQPRPEEARSPASRTFLRVWRFLVVLRMECQANHIWLRASSLTYTTILSLFPLLVLMTSVASFFYTPEQEDLLVEYIEQRLLPPSSPGILTPTQSAEIAEREREMAEMVQKIREMSAGFRRSAGGVGIAGFIALLVTAAFLYKSIEQAFESAWETGATPAMSRTIASFFTFLLLTPVVIWASITVSSIVVVAFSGKPMERTEARALPAVAAIPESGSSTSGPEVSEAADRGGLFSAGHRRFRWRLPDMLLALVPPFFNSIMLAMAYMLVPRTRVRLKYALIGGLAAGFLWEIAKVGFFAYVWISATRRQLLQSLGAVPIFLVWIYFTWIVFLLGNEITYLCQNWGRLTRRHGMVAGGFWYDTRLLAAVMILVSDSFSSERGGIAQDDLLDRMGAPGREMEGVLARLLGEGLLLRTADNRFVPGVPPEKIRLSRLFEMGCDPSSVCGNLDGIGRGGGMNALRDVQRRVLAAGQDATIADLLAAEPAPNPRGATP